MIGDRHLCGPRADHHVRSQEHSRADKEVAVAGPQVEAEMDKAECECGCAHQLATFSWEGEGAREAMKARIFSAVSSVIVLPLSRRETTSELPQAILPK